MCHKFRVKSSAIERLKEKWPFGVYEVYIEKLQPHEMSEVSNIENLLSKMWSLHIVQKISFCVEIIKCPLHYVMTIIVVDF